MTYGKLLVYLPDGTLEEHPLTKEITSIGRQPGNDIAVSTIAVSRYHAQIVARQGQAFIVDLETVNHTYVNDQAIAPNEEILLRHGDEIAMGDARIVFLAPGEDAAQSTTVRREPETTVIEGAAPLRVVLDEPHQSVAPGARLRLEMVIGNPTDETQHYVISLAGMEPEWVKANRHEVRLNPGEQTEATISVRPPRSSSTIPGVYPLIVNVAVKDDPSLYLEAKREVDVVGYSGFGMTVREGKQSNAYQIAVQNQGNVPMRIRLGGFHPDRRLRFAFDRVDLTLAPAQTEQVSLTVTPRGGQPFGHSEKTHFAIVARSLDAANYQAPVSMAYTITPSWSAWVAGLAIPLGIALVGLMTVVAVLVVAFGGFNPFARQAGQEPPIPTPTTAITPDNVVIAPTFTEQPEAPIPLPTDTATLTEAPPAAVDVIRGFEIDPPVVLANQVGNNVQLGWNVDENATGLSLSVVNPNNESIPLRPIGEGERIQFIPVEEFSVLSGQYTITLSAVGADGAPHTEQIVLTVRDACAILEDGSAVFARPGDVDAIATLAKSTVVHLLGQAGDRNWVQVIYEEDVAPGWVSRAALECQDIDNLDVIELEAIAPSTP